MAFSTCKGLTFAPYISDASGVATYGSGSYCPDYLCQVQIAYQREDVKEYADGHMIDAEKGLTGMTVTLEMADMPEGWRATALGEIAGTGTDAGLYTETDADPPFIGVGFILAKRYKGTTKYEAYWIHKAQFSSTGITSNTKRDQTQWEHESFEGSVIPLKLTSGAAEYRKMHAFTTEANAVAWLKTMGNVPAPSSSSSGNGG